MAVSIVCYVLMIRCTSTNTEPESSLKAGQTVIKSKFFKNPMHRSELALAGAQTTIEAWKRDEVPPMENDGILSAEDVSTFGYGSVATLELRRSLAIASAKLDRHRAEQTKNEAME